MRRILVGLLFFCTALVARAQQALRVGDLVPDLVLTHVVNTPDNTLALAKVPGKVTVLEFWGTWCSPCIPALQRLDTLQRRYPQQLQVVGISNDSEARLRAFLTKRPVTMPLVSAPDDEALINQLFPHRIVSHTVVFDQNRRVVAITSPEQLSEKVLRAVMAGQPVSLKPKQDLLTDNPLDFFPADTATRYAVAVRSYLQGVNGQLRHDTTAAFRHRRITSINVMPDQLFRQAYGYSYRRTLNELPDAKQPYTAEKTVCFDLIVPHGQEASLLPRMQQELARHFPIEARQVKQRRPVYVLQRLPAAKAWAASTKPEQASWSGKGIEAEGSRVEVLREFLENMFSKPVVDETGLTGVYDMVFGIQNENLHASVAAGLRTLGLELVEAERDIELLRLTPASNY